MNVDEPEARIHVLIVSQDHHQRLELSFLIVESLLGLIGERFRKLYKSKARNGYGGDDPLIRDGCARSLGALITEDGRWEKGKQGPRPGIFPNRERFAGSFALSQVCVHLTPRST